MPSLNADRLLEDLYVFHNLSMRLIKLLKYCKPNIRSSFIIRYDCMVRSIRCLILTFSYRMVVTIICMTVVSSTLLRAQRPNFSGQRNSGSSSGSEKPMTEIKEPDTTSIFEYYIDNLEKKSIQADTLLDQFHIYNPDEKGKLFSQTLGNLGSSSRHLFYQSERQQNGFDFGYHQFDLYKLDKHSFKQIKSKKAVSNLFFTPGTNQKNFMIKAQFSRPFKNDIQLTIDYQRILQEGIYTSQNTRSTYLGVSLLKSYENRDMLITAVTNANNEVHNGGISNTTLYNAENFNFRTRIPTFIENAFTRHADADIAINNYFTLKKYEGIRFRHEFAHKWGSFKFVDDDLSNQAFYGDFWKDQRGIRSFTKYKKWETSLWATLDVKNIHLQAGFNYSLYNIDQEPTNQNINDLSLLANINLKPFPIMTLNAEGYLGIGENVGEYTIISIADLDLFSAVDLSVNGTFKRYRPSLITQQAYINQDEIWQSSFSQALENTLGASLHIPAIGISVEMTQSALTNPIYFNKSALPEQHDGTILISQLFFKSHHRFKFLHFKNEIGLQNLDNNLLNLPQFLSEHELYAEGYIFKKRMKTRLGIRLKTVDSYTLAGYSPVHGVFHFQDDSADPYFYQGDVYVSFKVDSMRVFVRAENITQLYSGDVFNLVDVYPIFDYRLRFGVSWTLFN